VVFNEDKKEKEREREGERERVSPFYSVRRYSIFVSVAQKCLHLILPRTRKTEEASKDGLCFSDWWCNLCVWTSGGEMRGKWNERGAIDTSGVSGIGTCCSSVMAKDLIYCWNKR
jgi:hypothetical protein